MVGRLNPRQSFLLFNLPFMRALTFFVTGAYKMALYKALMAYATVFFGYWLAQRQTQPFKPRRR
ncbi:hypothetical protein B0J17DRAFT_648150 [Rhizoctonia solani]|nr:hypothetical protein B0J17DRAFT_648150 [Rhizoctonia solani]